MNPVVNKSVDRAIFDPLMETSASFLQDPYSELSEMRRRDHVVFSEKGNQWLVTGLAEANKLLRDNRYGKRMERWRHPSKAMRILLKLLGRQGLNNILRQDPPQHTRVRGLISSAFTPSVVRDLEAEIQSITDRLIDDFEKDGHADLIAQFAFPLPVTVIAELLGIPAEDRDKFKEWSTRITATLDGNVCPYKAARSFAASLELRGYLKKAIARKLKAHDGRSEKDLLTSLALINSEDEGRLSQEELISNSILLLIAGHETTVNLIGNGLYHLMRHPEQRRLLEERPELINEAVEEILRFDSPVQIVRRLANEDIELAGKTIRKGDALTVLIGACNRDPEFFPDPDSFSIERQNKKHVSFGAGIHYCLGAELARAEARIAISTILKRLPEMRLKEPVMLYRSPFALRGLQSLLVEF
ncbi:MAG: cytochrome P450 [Candidatus Melainabacteria bacterium]|nr:cytochrome P450 [Candidatus Melainabacteria bacterium]